MFSLGFHWIVDNTQQIKQNNTQKTLEKIMRAKKMCIKKPYEELRGSGFLCRWERVALETFLL